jgi:hypothetical protein
LQFARSGLSAATTPQWWTFMANIPPLPLASVSKYRSHFGATYPSQERHPTRRFKNRRFSGFPKNG